MTSLSVGPVGGYFGAPALAPAEHGAAGDAASDWIDLATQAAQSVGLEGLELEARRQIGDAWLDVALRLHRGGVDGSRRTLELMAVGAPAAILDQSEACAAEVTDVSALAFGIASAYLGAPRSPGGLEAPEPLRVDPVGLAAAIFCEDFFGGEVALGVHQALRTSSPRPEIRPTLEAMYTAARNRKALARAALSWLLSGPASGAMAALDEAFPAKISWEGFAKSKPGASDPALNSRGLIAPEWLQAHAVRCLDQELPRLRSGLLQKVCH